MSSTGLAVKDEEKLTDGELDIETKQASLVNHLKERESRDASTLQREMC
ncbi:MAG: hypothetical protein K2Y39_16825 [Candidatus Obscuribacterales bacterium]|nr:hypothetical protein [Candidatus Obscuribacterales bacterium]